MATNIDNIIIEDTLSANTITATTIFLGSSNINNVFVQNIVGGYLPISGGTVTGGTSFTANLSANTIYSGSTNLYDIFAKIDQVGGQSTYVQSGLNTYTAGTANAPTVNISAATLASLSVSGATTLNTLFATTVSGGTLFSGATNLYNIFAKADQVVNNVNAGNNITIGGTAISPIISVVESPSFNQLTTSGTTVLDGTRATTFSAVTVSAGTIYSGSTNLNNLFNIAESQMQTKASLSSATFTGQVNIPTLSATTLSATTTIFTNIKIPTSPISGYILTSDANGNGTWMASPVGSGITKIDIQTSASTSPISTTGNADVISLVAKNLGASATTYLVFFNGTLSNNNNAGSSTIQILKGTTVIAGSTRVITNGGASLKAARRNITSACAVTGVTSGDVIKVQYSASTGTVSLYDRTLTIIGNLTSNLA